MKSSCSKPIIVTSANAEFAYPLSIMLKSLELNLDKKCIVKVHVLYSYFPPRMRLKIENVVSCTKIELTWVNIKHDKLNKLKLDGHISIATYYRLLIEETFVNYDKVIYLDADIILTRCICQLWNEDFFEKHLLAVPHASKLSGIVSNSRGLPSYKLIGIPKDTKTFNAGVLVINLKLWRKDNISYKIFQYLLNYSDYVLWWDQDGLNAILYDKWRPLPAIWNVMTNHLSSFNSHKDSLLTEEEFKDVWNLPAIIHFAGPIKPYNTTYTGPFNILFCQYASCVNTNS